MENIRNMVIDPSKAKDTRDTQMLDGVAKTTPAEKATNVTKEYSCANPKPGALGGRNTGA